MSINFFGSNFEYIVAPPTHRDKAVVPNRANVTCSEGGLPGRLEVSSGFPVSTHDRGSGNAYLSQSSEVACLVNQDLESGKWKSCGSRMQLTLVVRKNT